MASTILFSTHSSHAFDPGDWQIDVMDLWALGGDGTNRPVCVDRYSPMQSMSMTHTPPGNGGINAEIVRMWTTDAMKQTIDADADCLILTGDQMDADGNWIEALRPRSGTIKNPEFAAVRNFMVRQGFDQAGADSCIGQNAGGRTRQEILDQFLVCLGAL